MATKKSAVKAKTANARVASKSGGKRGGVREGAGRPPGPWKFKTVDELVTQIQSYFDDCDPHWIWKGIYREKKDADTGLPLIDAEGKQEYQEVQVMEMSKQKDYTVSGLALWLHTTRETLLDYEKGTYDSPVAEGEERSVDFSDAIKRAKLAIENYAEQKLFGPNATGVIFNLKNNWGWKDKKEVEHSGEINRNATDEELDAIIERAERRKASQSIEA